MKVGLVAVDGHNNFPNLALMRLSAWHKLRGDTVEWWNGFEHYDRVYRSKVFTFTPDFNSVVNSDEIITGGTGYRDYGTLPPEVESTPPDYSIYPQFKRAMYMGCRKVRQGDDLCHQQSDAPHAPVFPGLHQHPSLFPDPQQHPAGPHAAG